MQITGSNSSNLFNTGEASAAVRAFHFKEDMYKLEIIQMTVTKKFRDLENSTHEERWEEVELFREDKRRWRGI